MKKAIFIVPLLYLYLCAGAAGFVYEAGYFIEDFTLVDHLGVPHSLSDYDDSVVLITWWADW